MEGCIAVIGRAHRRKQRGDLEHHNLKNSGRGRQTARPSHKPHIKN
jgi:hypothetical protein